MTARAGQLVQAATIAAFVAFVCACPGPGTSVRVLDREGAIACIEARKDKLKSIWARVSVSRTWPRGRRRVTAKIWGSLPSKLRIEAIGPLKQSVGVLAADSDGFSMLSYEDGVLYKGPSSETNMAKLLGITMTPRDMLGLLLGLPPVPEGHVSLNKDGGLSYSVAHGLGWMKIGLSQGCDVKKVELFAKGGECVYRAEVKAFLTVDGIELPKKVLFERCTKREKVVIKVREARLNLDIPAEAFEIRAPDGVRVEVLP